MGGLFGLPSKGMALSIWAPGKYNGLSVVDWEQPCREGLEVLMDKKMNVSWQCALRAQKAGGILSCITAVWPAGWGRWLSLCALPLWGSIWSTTSRSDAPRKNDLELLEQVFWSVRRMVRGLEHLSFEGRLRPGGLQPGKGSGKTLKQSFST